VAVSRKQSVEAAGRAAREIAEGAGLSLAGLTGIVRRFSEVEFEVPELPDADGDLFQYGRAGWLPEPTFVLGILRQFEVVGSAGEHESYVHVEFACAYPMDDDLDAVGSHAQWWFPGGEVSFGAWLDSVDRAPVMSLLAAKTPRGCEIRQEHV
jgi:hypothetical protein